MSRTSARRALLGRSSTLAVLAALLASCESTPCVGETCPDACNGTACGDAPSDSGSEPAVPDAGEPARPDGGTDAGGPAPGRFGDCRADEGCDVDAGFSCVRDVCRHPCRTHADCGGVARCESLEDLGTFCALTEPPTTPGGWYSSCPTGECDESGGFVCVGAGVGDAGSVCTRECAGDGECPAGYLCTPLDGADEARFCMPKGFCAPCESDADCLFVPGGVCATDASGARTCTTLCDPGRDSCPWGRAAECRLTDEALGQPTCQHRFGACRGDGLGCHPCVRDDDCGGGDCIASSYSGERWCLDREVPCSCEGLRVRQDFCAGPDNGCPDAPSGLPMACFDPGTRGDGICVGVNVPGTGLVGTTQLACWR